MPSLDPVHPTPERLRAFAQGCVEDEELALIAEHLEGCLDCCALMTNLPADDPFQSRLQSVARTEEPPQQAEARQQAVRALLLGLSQAVAERETAIFPDEPIGPHTIQGYHLIKEVGRGGMGVVYQAQDLGLKRLVALKMMLSGRFASAEQVVRFRLEAEMAARIQHPNIVGVYEVGEHEGRPFLALEWVEGGTLADRLCGKAWSARPAAELVATLARAAHAAHCRGVIHRDLKPANVLLSSPDLPSPPLPPGGEGRRTESGTEAETRLATPKIADFGLALPEDRVRGLTESGVIVGTPDYMAPEQALGKKSQIGPATDVYALGVILYELLVGRPPFRDPRPEETVPDVAAEASTAISQAESNGSRRSSPLEVLNRVVEQDPIPPSRLLRGVPRDLETICLKCLEKAPQRRYATAEALAQDLERYLRGEPITARTVSIWERAVKWMRRRPGAALALACIGTLLAVLLIGGWTYNARLRASNQKLQRLNDDLRELNEKEKQARLFREKNFGKALEAVEFLLTDVAQDALLNVPHAAPLRRRLLEKALEFYRGFLDQKGDDPDLRYETAEAFRRVAIIHQLLDHTEEAISHLQGAISILGRLADEFPDRPDYADKLGACYISLGNLLGRQSKMQEGVQLHEKAHAIFEKLSKDYPANSEYRRRVAVSQSSLGIAYRDQNRNDKARAALENAVEVLEQLVKESPDEPLYLRDLERFCLNLAAVYKDAKQLTQAERCYRRAVLIDKGLVKVHPNDHLHQARLGEALLESAQFAVEQSRLDEAKTACGEAIACLEALTRDHSEVPEYQATLAKTYTLRWVLLRDSPDKKAADRDIQRATDLHEHLVKLRPQSPVYRRQVVKVHQDRGDWCQWNQQLPQAEQSYRKAIEHRKILLTLPHATNDEFDLVVAHQRLSSIYSRQNRRDKAEEAYRQAVAGSQQLMTRHPKNPQYQFLHAMMSGGLAELYFTIGRHADAEAQMLGVLPIYERLARQHAGDAGHQQRLAMARHTLAAIYHFGLKDYKKAEPLYQKAGSTYAELVRKEPDSGSHAVNLGGVYCNHGNLLQVTDRLHDALASFDKAIEILKRAQKIPGEHRQQAEQFLRNAEGGRTLAAGRLKAGG